MTFLITTALCYRWVVLGTALGVVSFGLWCFQHLNIDAYPDISAQSVHVITVYPGRAPEDVERQVTVPLENGLIGLPRVGKVRSRTIFGLSVVQILFDDGTESYWARQRVTEKLREIELPEGIRPVLGPLATAFGEVFRYELVSDGTADLIDLHTLNDWVVIRHLSRVPGVAQVTNFGGLEKQYAVTFSQIQLKRQGLTITDLEDAIRRNKASGGGSLISRGSMSLVVRSKGQIESIEDIENVFIKSIDGTPVFIKDVASVDIDHKMPNGIFSKDYINESVAGFVVMRKGENPSQVIAGVKRAIQELNGGVLPAGVRIRPFYDRTQLTDATLHTVSHSVAMGITLVILVLMLFLGRPVMTLLVALTIPFALLFALGMMYMTSIPIGLLSVGSIDFGIIVDASVIMADSMARRLNESQANRPREVLGVIRSALLDMHRPVLTAFLLVTIAFLPLLFLTQIEGLLFRPMVLTILFALLGGLLFALFVLPVLVSFCFQHGYLEWKNPLLTLIIPWYQRSVDVLIKIRWVIAGICLAVVIYVFGPIYSRLGVSFLPSMDEGVIWVRIHFPEGTSLEQTSIYGRRLREVALEFPEIQFVTAQAGRNDSGNDPFPPSRLELMIAPKPQACWEQFHTKQQLTRALSARYHEEFPTTRFNFTQPIHDSVTEENNGVSANMAVEITGSDIRILSDLARKTMDLLQAIPGSSDVNIEQEGPQPQLVIQPDRNLCSRYNVRLEDVAKLVNMPVGGTPVSTLYDREKRFEIVVRLDRTSRESLQSIGMLPVSNADGNPIPLSQVATISVVDGQTMIARDEGHRQLTVRSDITLRDHWGFVKRAQEEFAAKIQVPSGYQVKWLGLYENLDRAYHHFEVLIPFTLVMVFAVLYVSYRSFRATLVLLLPLPFAFAAGILALYLRGLNLSVAAGVGFATLLGIALMDGVLMFKGIMTYRAQGLPLHEAIIRGRLERLRPILITSTVAILGLLPASLATSLGSDVQRPLATVIVWGLAGSTLFTLFLTPVFYRLVVPPQRGLLEETA